MLNLGGLKIVKGLDPTGGYVLEMATTQAAPICGCSEPALVSNGRKDVSFVATPMHGKRLTITVKRRRYLCRGCESTHYADIPHMHVKHRLTHRCYEYIIKDGALRPWKALGQELGINPIDRIGQRATA